MEEEATVDIAEDATLFGAADRLRRARETAGLKLEDVAAETRISLRHLADMERGDWDALPGRTYAIGFARNFARAVGLDQNEIAAEVRSELDLREPSAAVASKFEPGDPARIPSSGLAWFSVLDIMLLGAGLFFFFRPYIFPAGELPPLVRDEAPAAVNGTAGNAPTRPVLTADPAGAVIFTSLEEGIWVKFYDEKGAQLMQKQMGEGERYIVPADAAGPQLWTGRPDALAITIGGREIPKLAEEDQVMRDVPVSAEALLARAEESAAATGTDPTAAVSTN